MKIEDNFLDQEKFDELQTHMLGEGNNFSWCYGNVIDYKEDEDTYQFVHVFYTNQVPSSPSLGIMAPILDKIIPMSLWRIKANLLTRTLNIVENTFHVDIGDFPEEKLKQWTTSIFYTNTNNGYTEFKDGTKVESVANRMVTFPANLKHRGTSCTDEKIRVVINLNYFK